MIAEEGIAAATKKHHSIRLGINVAFGKITYPALAQIFRRELVNVDKALGQRAC